MTFYISVVSHQHHHIIENLDSLRRLSSHNNIVVICRDNVPNVELQKYCSSHDIHYLKNRFLQGFSANNNLSYLYAKESLGMKADDYFILMNPDVYIDQKNIKKLLDSLHRGQPEIAAPNLFIDAKQTAFDDNLRKYPKLKNFFKNYILHDRSTVIDKKTSEPEKLNYWVSASFLCVRSRAYEDVDGFDETYHMYCEDVDFCFRALSKGYAPCFLRTVKATHYRRCSSQKFLSRAFLWHVKSVFLYSLAKSRLRSHRSILKKNRNDTQHLMDKKTSVNAASDRGRQ